MINTSVINDIYDNKNNLNKDLCRSFLSLIITYIIGLVIYYLTNIKRVLIKRRYKINNLRISNNKRLAQEIMKITDDISKKFIFHKLIILCLIFLFIHLYSGFVCFSFCKTYPFTQFLILKCVIICILISQITPFVLCWIPAYLRKLSLTKKNIILYDLTKRIELLFIPW